MTELWQKVAAHNEASPPPHDADRVTFYFGQNVISGASVDKESGTQMQESAEPEQQTMEERE